MKDQLPLRALLNRCSTSLKRLNRAEVHCVHPVHLDRDHQETTRVVYQSTVVSTNSSDTIFSALNATGAKMVSSLTQMEFHVLRDQLQDVDQWKSQHQTTWDVCQDVQQWKSGRMADA